MGVEHVKAHRHMKEKKICRSLRGLSLKATRSPGIMAEAKAETVQQEREEVFAALQYAASFHCLVEEWTDCEELRPKPKESGFLWKRRARI